MGSGFASGYATGSDGRDVCIQAIDLARRNLDRPETEVALALVFSSSSYPLQDVLNGAGAQLRDTPVLGISTPAVLTEDGPQESGVAVALFAGRGRVARTGWWEPESLAGGTAPERILADLGAESAAPGMLFFFTEGGSASRLSLAEAMAQRCPARTLAGLVAGEQLAGDMFLFGNRSGGHGGACGAYLSGDFQVGIGSDHGWRPSGLYFRISRAEGDRILEIDREAPTAFYARIFAQEPSSWLLPPLNELVRLYPIGLEQDGGPLLLRSPQRVEMDGSLRMSGQVAGDQTAHLLIGSAGECRQAIRRAAHQARQALGEASPKVALVVADLAWKMLAEVQPIDIAGAVRQAAGADIPIAGCYTLAQISQGQILNQHIQIALFGE